MTTQQEALRGVIKDLGNAAFNVYRATLEAANVTERVGAELTIASRHEVQIGSIAAVQRDVEQIHGLYIAALAIHRSMPKGDK